MILKLNVKKDCGKKCFDVSKWRQVCSILGVPNCPSIMIFYTIDHLFVFLTKDGKSRSKDLISHINFISYFLPIADSTLIFLGHFYYFIFDQ